MLRILHCVAGLSRGGYETFIMNVYRKIDRTKIQFDFLYSFDGVFNHEILAMGGKLYKVPFITQTGPFEYARQVNLLLKAHPEYKIIHSHMDKFSGLIMKIAKKNNVPVRIAHGHSISNEGNLIFKAVKNYYGKMINKYCTHKFACSADSFKWMFCESPKNGLVIKNGIELEKFAGLDLRDQNHFTIINVARFSKTKNHDFLIDIFEKIHNKNNSARLILAGTGETQEAIKQKALALNLINNVEFLNDCNDVATALARADVFCMPSLFEGLPVSLIEAQAVGLNCVVSDTVTTDANITGNVKYIALEKSAEFWADEILKYQDIKRTNTHEKIIESGFDISATAEILKNFYLESVNI